MQKIYVYPNDERNVECNCCDYDERNDNDPLYVVKFKTGNMSSVVRLCERHLLELQVQIRENL